MFLPRRWAEAFVNSLDENAEEAFGIFKILVQWINRLPGSQAGSAVFGAAAAEQVNIILKKAGVKTGASESMEGASRFLTMLIGRNRLRYSPAIITEIQKILDVKNKKVRVILESVYPAGEQENEIKEIVRKRTGAGEVHLENKIRPELIGGFRLRINDEVIDASVLSRLRQMEEKLSGAKQGAVNG